MGTMTERHWKCVNDHEWTDLVRTEELEEVHPSASITIVDVDTGETVRLCGYCFQDMLKDVLPEVELVSEMEVLNSG